VLWLVFTGQRSALKKPVAAGAVAALAATVATWLWLWSLSDLAKDVRHLLFRRHRTAAVVVLMS